MQAELLERTEVGEPPARAGRHGAAPEAALYALEPRFRLPERIAEGGVSTIYRVWDRQRRAHVALKLLPPGERADGWQARHLCREAEVARVLEHPSLARLLEAGETEGRPYLVYEYLPHGSLAQALSMGRLYLPGLMPALARVARGLAYMHSRGWVHADVKPGNILFGLSGRVCLIDFGLARAIGKSSVEGGQVIASAPYASPEQAAGQPLQPASDVYSLCAALYEAVTGLHVRASELLAEGVGERGATVQRLLEVLCPELPGSVAEILVRGLAPSPGERYGDGAALAAALEACAVEPLPWLPMGLRARPAWMEEETLPHGRVRAA